MAKDTFIYHSKEEFFLFLKNLLLNYNNFNNLIKPFLYSPLERINKFFYVYLMNIY